ncbi:hypothetical protein BaRGS_00033617 [Batillaria attramentaria]|uniref:Uncharacterized protein n=1 Tax=Batillaria attramentaria TaxID=370345 RepID=A0ABD0JK91_9CAEN
MCTLTIQMGFEGGEERRRPQIYTKAKGAGPGARLFSTNSPLKPLCPSLIRPLENLPSRNHGALRFAARPVQAVIPEGMITRDGAVDE